MMQIEQYFEYYDSFDSEFFSMATDDDVLEKFGDEMQEAMIELDAMGAGYGDKEALIGETIDAMNMAIKTLRMYGINDPLQAGADKLALTTAKYREQRGN